MHPEAYPKRPPFFANRFCRLMTKVALANQIGPEACFLLMTVAMTEDAKSYRGAVTYWNEQLMPLIGVNSVKSLIRIRNKAIESGWLHYEQGGKGVVGRYWVVVPREYEGTDDKPVDEDAREYQPVCHGENDTTTAGEVQENRRTSAGEVAPIPVVVAKTTGEVQGKRQEKCSTSGNHSSLSCPTPEPPTPGGGGLVTIEPIAELLAEWTAAKLPGHDAPGGVRPTATRRGLWQQRLSDPRWAAEWREAVRRLGRSEKARGLSAGFARGVRLDDLLGKPDYLTRILEGEFDDSPVSRSKQPERWYDE